MRPGERPAVGPRDELADIPEYELREIAHFFDIYKDLEPGKRTEVVGWAEREAAEATIESSRQRFQARSRERTGSGAEDLVEAGPHAIQEHVPVRYGHRVGVDSDVHRFAVAEQRHVERRPRARADRDDPLQPRPGQEQRDRRPGHVGRQHVDGAQRRRPAAPGPPESPTQPPGLGQQTRSGPAAGMADDFV